jgi:hypothetical protein
VEGDQRQPYASPPLLAPRVMKAESIQPDNGAGLHVDRIVTTIGDMPGSARKAPGRGLIAALGGTRIAAHQSGRDPVVEVVASS